MVLMYNNMIICIIWLIYHKILENSTLSHFEFLQNLMIIVWTSMSEMSWFMGHEDGALAVVEYDF